MMMEAMTIGDGPSSGGEINLVSALMTNSAGQGGYFTGIKPDCPARDNVTFNLGDPREKLLREALQLLANGTCSQARQPM
jgi:hypothetical protein